MAQGMWDELRGDWQTADSAHRHWRNKEIQAHGWRSARGRAEQDEMRGNSAEATKMKNPAAVELGRRGGLKGGPARAQKLTSEQRSAIGRAAVDARWRKHNDRPAIHVVVRNMLDIIEKTGKAQAFFVEGDMAWFSEIGSITAVRWQGTKADCLIGVYEGGATFSSVMSDVMAQP